jgi:hypothetical protein
MRYLVTRALMRAGDKHCHSGLELRSVRVVVKRLLGRYFSRNAPESLSRCE